MTNGVKNLILPTHLISVIITCYIQSFRYNHTVNNAKRPIVGEQWYHSKPVSVTISIYSQNFQMILIDFSIH